MQQSATDFYESWPAKMNAMKATPGGTDIGKAFGPFFQGVMKDAAADGGLAVKHKELIALGIGIAVRCEPCSGCCQRACTHRQSVLAGCTQNQRKGPQLTLRQ
jgi:alkylhydroperoxidase/carboxymuconolactone decarboxylase family protein YurZ